MHYSYICEGDSYYFVTDQSIYYKASITNTSNYVRDDLVNGNDLYSLSFNIISGHSTASQDKRIFLTIEAILKEWFSVNNKVLYYICSNTDGRAEERLRLFSYWFKQSFKRSPEGFYYTLLLKQLELDNEDCYVGFIYKDEYPDNILLSFVFEDSLVGAENKQ
ncbi:MAG: DUF6169 family protein [Bacteroidia bacterium]|jgi:hypothetical protein|nr:DUF6169 family protein [Bacteroidia bacterium]